MTTSTTNLGLKTYNSTTDASATFTSFRSDIAGISPTSNMGLIDNWAGLVNGSLVSLSTNAIYTISATYISSNYYEASSTELTSYATDVIIALTLNTTSSGTVTLNINGLGTKTLQKIDVNGNVANLDASELKKNKLYLFKYSGTSWVWIGATSADQISASGVANHLITISGCGVLIDSGVSASLINYLVAPSTASYVVLSLNPNLSNEWLLSSGSNISLSQDSSSSSIIISSHYSASSVTAYGTDGNLLMISGSGEYSVISDSGFSSYDIVSASTVAPATGSYIVLELNSELSNEKKLTAGSGISLNTNFSASTLSIDNNIVAGSGITLIKNTSASTIIIRNNFFVDQSGSMVKTYGTISGSVSGTRTNFTVSKNKFDSGTLLVYLNGQLQTQGAENDWVETSASLGVFTFITAPVVGDSIICHYTLGE